MDIGDRTTMSQAFGDIPYRIDASGLTLAHRPRLYWCDWELLNMEGAQVFMGGSTSREGYHEVSPAGTDHPSRFP